MNRYWRPPCRNHHSPHIFVKASQHMDTDEAAIPHRDCPHSKTRASIIPQVGLQSR